MHRPTSFFDAWVEAASGLDGFWLRSRPGDHFRTASATGPELADAVLALLDRRPRVEAVVEVGAGDARLLEALHERRPALDLAGIDLRSRPPALPGPVTWVQDRWDVHGGGWAGGEVEQLLAARQHRPVLLLAVEWLDDLPCRLAARRDDTWAELDRDGQPTVALGPAEETWLRDWWPVGARAEVGSTRDRAWGWLVGALRRSGGLAVAIDYGHELATRPAEGSLAAYRAGRRVAPRPAPDRNLTAHVAVDALAAAGVGAGARTVLRQRQGNVLADLLPALPPGTGGLDALTARSRRSALTSPTGWGGHWWLLQEVAPRAVAA